MAAHTASTVAGGVGEVNVTSTWMLVVERMKIVNCKIAPSILFNDGRRNE